MPCSGPHVLLLSPGSKVALTRALARAVQERGGTLTGWERDSFSPAATLCARVAGGECIESPGAADRLLTWCLDSGVRLVVPSRHDDLTVLAESADRFARAGIALAVSSPEAVRLCVDKVASHEWLTQRGLPVPAQCRVAELGENLLAGQLPLVAKDPRGSGSRQLRFCRTPRELAEVPTSWIVQELAPGIEYTINVYVDRHGRSICEIPHERMLVGDGEVVRGRTARIEPLMSTARAIAEKLPGARGPMNVQIFWDEPTARVTVIEINPRFGGGYPLAEEAGGRFAEWLLLEYVDRTELPRLDTWEEGLVMARYREAAFFRTSSQTRPHSP